MKSHVGDDDAVEADAAGDHVAGTAGVEHGAKHQNNSGACYGTQKTSGILR